MEGPALLEAFAEVEANVETSHTFRREGFGSILDLAYVNAALASKIAWQVSEDYIHDEQQTICIEIEVEPSSKQTSRVLGR